MHDDDAPQHPLRPISPRRLAVTVGAALALILLVVVASHGDRPTGGSAGGAQTASTVLVDVILLVLAIVAAGMVVTTLLSFQPVRDAGDPKPRTGAKLFGQVMAFIVIIGIIVAAVHYLRGDGAGQRGNPPGSAARSALKKLDKEKHGQRQNVDWLPVILVFGAALVAFTAAGVVVLRRGPLPPSDDLADRLAVVFDETLEDLRAEGDPRRAVIGAYARMERILGRHGLPRRPAEAPHEYVSRVLEDLISSGSSVRRLTRLYERAKFSAHDVDPAMKEEAIDAVAAVRDELHAREAEVLITAPH